jgi:hypothetical protein
MKLVLIILSFLLTCACFAQSTNDTIRVIAKLSKAGEGSRIYIAEYEVIKVIKGELNANTIKVGYYFDKGYDTSNDTVILNLINYSGFTEIINYYIFPNYDAKKGIESITISYIHFDYWEGCETGYAPCIPLTFTRNENFKNWYLFMPCGGTSTSVTLSKKPSIPLDTDILQLASVGYSECPPVFELTNLTEGTYCAYMLACGLGGQVVFNLISNK